MCIGAQIETSGLIDAACRPSSIEIDRFGDVTTEMNNTEAKNTMRPFRHSGKKSLGLPCVKTIGARVCELDAVGRNYIAIASVTFHLKPEIITALNQLRDRMYGYAFSAPRSEPIFRAIGKFFLQSIEDILHMVGRGTMVEQIAQMIGQINFCDAQTEHSSLVSVHHIQNSPAAMAALAKFNGNKSAGSPPSAPAAAGAPSGAGGAGGVGDGGGLSKRARLRANKKDKNKQATGGAAATSGAGGGASLCPWFCSTLGCDPAKKRDGNPCKANRHVLPTKEATRLELLSTMAKFALTARPDFPASCPP
jgi:hypothetical protein